MKVWRVFRFADRYARLRTRLGTMPDAEQWNYIFQASDLDNLIERMRSHGLGDWLKELPRNPDLDTLERHLYRRCVAFVGNFVKQIPREWSYSARLLRALPDIYALRLLMTQESPSLLSADESPLWIIRDRPRSERTALLEGTIYGDMLVQGCSPEQRWLECFIDSVPVSAGIEARMVKRLRDLLVSHQAQVQKLRKSYRDVALSAEAPATPVPEDAQWHARSQLMRDIRALVAASDSLHGGFILIYGMLEALQFERMRALLLAYAHGWRSVGAEWTAA